MNEMKVLFFLAVCGHLLCGISDCLITYVPGGKFQFSDIRDSKKMKETFSRMPESRPIQSVLLGVLALLLISFGGYGVFLWMKQYSLFHAAVILISLAVFLIPGTAHHVICGTAEWFYLKMGRTEEALKIIIQYFTRTAATMAVCYIGLIVFCITLFHAVAAGMTSMPAWSCVFNALPVGLILTLLHIGGGGNWACALMYLSLLIIS